MAKKKEDPSDYIQRCVIEARRLVQMARTGPAREAVDHWIDAGLQLQFAQMRIGEAVLDARRRKEANDEPGTV